MPLKLVASDVTIEGGNIEEFNAAVQAYRDLEPLLYLEEDKPGVTARASGAIISAVTGEPSGRANLDELDERALCDLYKEKFGRRFMYRPDGAHRGKTKIEALREVLA